MGAKVLKRGKFDRRTDEEYRLVLERRHNDLVGCADAVNVCWTIGNREVAGIDHSEVNVQGLPELSGAPGARLSAFLSALVSPTFLDALAAFDIFTAIFMKTAHIRLEPWIKNGRTLGLQKLANPVTPAELFFDCTRSDKIHRARE